MVEAMRSSLVSCSVLTSIFALACGCGDSSSAETCADAAGVVARAMQTYGMFLADGGQIALTGQSDRFTTNKWDGLLAPQDLVALRPSDFEVIDHGALLDWSQQSCERAPLGTPP